MANWLLTIFEHFPRINFAFFTVPNTFMFVDDRDYLQSLIFWAAIPLVLCLLLCVIVLIIWSLRCCRRGSDAENVSNERPAKRRIEVDRFACGFYAPIFFLCLVAGVCLYANEWSNRGMTSFVASLDDLKHSANSLFDGINRINETVSNVSRLQKSLQDDISTKGGHLPRMNLTALSLLTLLVGDLNYNTGNITHGLKDMELRFIGFRNAFDALPDWIARIELERWVLFVILFSTLFVIGVFGLIAVCKRSRNGSIGYGVGGIFVFVVGWALAGAALFISLMLADACTDPKPYIESKLSPNSSRVMFRFYVECVTDSKGTDNNPISVDTKAIELEAAAADKHLQEALNWIAALFPIAMASEMQRQLGEIRASYGKVVQEVSGAVELIDCRHVRREYESAANALCYNALPGFALALLFTLIFCLTLFGVLIAVSKAWTLFKKRMNDYMEVDSQDPFSIHRGTSHHSGSVLLNHDQSNIPADFYGTHVFNPRTRFASAAFADEVEQNGNATAPAPTWRNTPPPAYDSMHRAQQMQQQQQRRQQQSTTTRTMA